MREATIEEENAERFQQIFYYVDRSCILNGTLVVAVDEWDEGTKEKVAKQIVSERVG